MANLKKLSQRLPKTMPQTHLSPRFFSPLSVIRISSQTRQQKRLFEKQIRLRTSTYPSSPQLTVGFSLGGNRPTTKMELFSIDVWNSSQASCRDWPGGIGARVILYGGGRWGKELKAMIKSPPFDKEKRSFV
jgi:hypothetical protein